MRCDKGRYGNIGRNHKLVETLLNPDDDEWVRLVGRYILDLGVIEMATREWIATMEGENAPVMTATLAKRIEFIKVRLPAKEARTMRVFEVAEKHTLFRNTVAHSPLVITGYADGSFHIHGLLDIPKKQPSSIVGIDELRGRVDESSVLVNQFRQVIAEALKPP